MRRSLALVLAAACWQCEPAEPLPLTDATPASDVGVLTDRAVADLAAPCPDDDNDGVPLAACAPAGAGDCDDNDPAIRPGAADPCGDGVDQDCDGVDRECPTGCEMNPTLDPCDDVDDDCDGRVDECSGTCDGGACLGVVDSPCAADADCADRLRCVDGACTPLEPGGLCDDDPDCPADATCARQIACDPDLDRCYAGQGGRCLASCDCSGAWLCAEDTGRCVTCLIDAQCDGDAICVGGLCATPTRLGGDGIDALIQLLDEIADCADAHRGVQVAHGCRILETGTLTIDGAPAGAIEPPTPAAICDADLTARGLPAEQVPTVRDLYGCDDGRVRVRWEAPLPAERDRAACLSYLPPWASTANGVEAIAIAPCNTLLYTRD